MINAVCSVFVLWTVRKINKLLISVVASNFFDYNSKSLKINLISTKNSSIVHLLLFFSCCCKFQFSLSCSHIHLLTPNFPVYRSAMSHIMKYSCVFVCLCVRKSTYWITELQCMAHSHIRFALNRLTKFTHQNQRVFHLNWVQKLNHTFNFDIIGFKSSVKIITKWKYIIFVFECAAWHIYV